MAVTEKLLELEHAGWRSLCDGTGDEFYGGLMTDDALMVLANGMVMDRQTVVDALAESPPWRTYAIEDVRLIAVDTDTAILVYTGIAYRDGDAPAFTGAMASVYHRVDGDWKLALYQQTQRPD